MEHFFNRKPTKGYIQLAKENTKDHVGEYDIQIPKHVSKAACYVEDARDGRLANGKGKMSEMSHKIQLFFFIQTHAWWSRFIYMSIAFMSFMSFFEPASTASITVCTAELYNFSMNISICDDSGIITPWEPWTLLVEFLMIMIFVSDVIMKAVYMQFRVYCTKKWHKISAFFILLFIFDWTIFLFTYYIGGIGFRFSRPFRPVLLLTRNRDLRRILETLLSMMNDLIKQITIILAFIILFAWVGVILYEDVYLFTDDCVDLDFGNVSSGLNKDPDYCKTNICWNTTVFPYCICTSDSDSPIPTGCDDEHEQFSKHYLPEEMDVYNGTFRTVYQSFIRLMVLISTENYPDVLLPAYKANNWNILYFVAFIFIGMFLLMSVLLAVIVEFWLTYLKQTNDNEKRKERLGLSKAFTWIDKERNYHINEESWNELILLLKKDFTKLQSQFMFEILDWEQKGHLDVLDFLNITEALKLQYKLQDLDDSSAIQNTRIGRFAGRLLNWKYTISFCGVIKDKKINITKIGKAVVMLHTLLGFICTFGLDETTITGLRAINTVLMFILGSELGLHIFAKGRTYCHTFTNKWEIFSITTAFLAMVVYWIRWLISGSHTLAVISTILWEIVIILRPSIAGNSLLFLYKVFTVLIDLFLFIIIFVLVFMGIGLELFAIQSNGGESNYFEHYDCGVGFSKPTCGLLTLWQQITTSNWHDMMNDVYNATGFWAYVYFDTFYIMINLILLDLTIAMTIEMYNAIKSQYFSKKSGSDNEDYDGVFFEIYDNNDDVFHHRLNPNNAKKKNFSKASLQLQVLRSTAGSWRQSVLNSDTFNICTEDLNKLQKSLETEKIGHGEFKGNLYLNSKEYEMNLRLMSDEKANEAKNLDNPECELYFLFPIINYEGNEVGELVMELKDHHSYDANIKLNFNSTLSPYKWQIESEVNGNEKVHAEYIETFMKKQELLNGTHDYHGYQSTHWSIKKLQRVQLRNDNIKVVIYLNPEEDEDGLNPIDTNQAQLRLTSHIKGYKKERKRWDDKIKEVAQTRKIFANISGLLLYNAYRVSIKEEVKKGKSGDDTEIGKVKADTSCGKIIYILEKDNDSFLINKTAHKQWKIALRIERNPATRNRELLRENKHIMNFMRKRTGSTNPEDFGMAKDKNNGKPTTLSVSSSTSSSSTPTPSPSSNALTQNPARKTTLVNAMLKSTTTHRPEHERALLNLMERTTQGSQPGVVKEESEDSETSSDTDDDANDTDSDSDDCTDDTQSKDEKSGGSAASAIEAIKSSLRSMRKSAETITSNTSRRGSSSNLQIPRNSDPQITGTPTSIRSSSPGIQLEEEEYAPSESGLLVQSQSSSPRTPKLFQKFKRAISRQGLANVENEPETIQLDSSAPTVIVTNYDENNKTTNNQKPLGKNNSAP